MTAVASPTTPAAASGADTPRLNRAAPSRAAPPPSARAWALLALLAAIWGGSFFLIEIALQEIPPFTLVAHRVFWAALALWVFLGLTGRLSALRVAAPLLIGWAMMGVLNNLIPFSLIVWGQTAIESGLAAIFNATTALFGAVVAALLLRDERLTARKAVGVAVGLAGVVLIVGPGALSGLDPQSLGQLAILGASLSYAFASVWGRVRLTGAPPELNALGMLTASSAMTIPLAMAVDGPPQLGLSLEAWTTVLALSVIATGGAYLLYFRILAIAGAANTMLVTLLIPPVAIGLGASFLGERLDLGAYLGFAVIAVGLAIIDGRLFRRD